MSNSKSKEIAGKAGEQTANELATQEANRDRELSIGEVVHRRRMVEELMKGLMKEDHHYGKISGTDRNTLLQPGAQLIDTMFRFSPRFDVDRQDISYAESSIPPGHREYTVTCNLYHIDSGVFVAQGVGSCTTLESKYRYRTAKRHCPECGAEVLMKSKYDDAKWYCNPKKGGCGTKIDFNDPRMENQHQGKVENPDIADVYNTVLKMAKKRAYVDATITAAAASDMFTQDMEDFTAPHYEPESVPEPPQAETVEYTETNQPTETPQPSTEEPKTGTVEKDRKAQQEQMEQLKQRDEEKESRQIVHETVEILQSRYFTEDEQQGYKDAIKHIPRHNVDTFKRLRDKYKTMMADRKEAEQEYEDAMAGQEEDEQEDEEEQ